MSEPEEFPQFQRKEIHIARCLALGLAGAVVIYPLIALANPTIISDHKLLDLNLNLKILIALAATTPLWLANHIERTIRSSGRRKFDLNGNKEALNATFLLEIIVGFTIREMSAIVGFGLSSVTAEPLWAVALSTITLASMVSHWPREAP